MDRLTSRLDMAKEKFSELEDRSKTLSRMQRREAKETKCERGDGKQRC